MLTRVQTLLVLALAATTTSAAAQPPPAASGDATAGRRLFVDDGCSNCHGTRGLGSGIAPTLVPLLPRDAFIHQLRAPLRAMPAYSAVVVTDAQADDMIAYLRTIKPGRPAADIPLLHD
jgi:mono/diheme cytochrome c family protein